MRGIGYKSHTALFKSLVHLETRPTLAFSGATIKRTMVASGWGTAIIIPLESVRVYTLCVHAVCWPLILSVNLFFLTEDPVQVILYIHTLIYLYTVAQTKKAYVYMHIYIYILVGDQQMLNYVFLMCFVFSVI